MKIFLDTAEVEDIRYFASIGIIDGVTTNPTLIHKAARPFTDILKEICQLVNGSISAEVSATTKEGMLEEAYYLADISPQITIKLPTTMDGLATCKELSNKGIDVNMTLIFNATQALLAAKAGARYVSPFIGRIDDMGACGMDLIASIISIYDNYEYDTQVLVASVRTVNHVAEAAELGADVATIPPAIMHAMIQHPLTDLGIERFAIDWKKTGQNIIPK